MTTRSTQIRDGRYVQGGKVEPYQKLMGWWERYPLSRDNTDVSLTITAKYHTRPDLLAYDVYGRTGLMWLVLQFNNIVDINAEFIEGATIVLPTLSRVHTELLTRAT